MFRLLPVTLSARIAPAMASGTVSMIISGWIQLSNCAASTRNTISRARPKVMKIADDASVNSSAMPL